VAAQTVLGICYLDGIEVEVSYEEAFSLLSKAARYGVPRAMANLARMYAKGLGVQRDLLVAVNLYEGAARAGEFFAQVELGRMYSRGMGVSPDIATARKWYSAALAQQGRVADCEELREARAYLAGQKE
jgi:hypothetical protein